MSAEAGADELRVESREEGPITRWVEVEVPAAQVASAFERAYRGLARSSRVRGFRPGKAPRSVLQKMYGPAVAEDLERELVGETLAAALEKSGVEPVCQPQVESDPPSEGSPFVYRARVEVKPEFALGDWKGLPAQRPATDGERRRRRSASWSRCASATRPSSRKREGVAAANGHLITMDFEGRIDGVAFEGGTAKDVTVEIGAGQLIPGFDEQLRGRAAPAKSAAVRVRFPDDYAQGRISPARTRSSRCASRRCDAARCPRSTTSSRRISATTSRTLDQVRAKIRESMIASRERASQGDAAPHAARCADRARTLRRAAGPRRGATASPPAQRRRTISERRGVGRSAVDRQMARWEHEWRPLVEREVREEWLLAEVARAQRDRRGRRRGRRAHRADGGRAGRGCREAAQGVPRRGRARSDPRPDRGREGR